MASAIVAFLGASLHCQQVPAVSQPEPFPCGPGEEKAKQVSEEKTVPFAIEVAEENLLTR